MSEENNRQKPQGSSRPQGQRNDRTKTAVSQRRTGPRPEGQKPAYGQHKAGPRPEGQKPAYGQHKAGPRPEGQKPAYGQHKAGPRPEGQKPAYGQHKAGPRPEGQKPAGSSTFRWDGRKPAGSTDRRNAGPRTGERRFTRPGTDSRKTDQRSKPAMEGLESRRIALQVIRKVTEDGAYASLALDTALRDSGLSAADRRLVSRLVYDTLDHLIYLDHALSQVMAREDTDIRLKNILRLGACQLLLEDRIPESAATNTSVQLCVELGMEGLKGVCNGILRNLIRKKEELSFPDPETESDRWHAVKYSVPEWLWVRLKNDYGTEEAERIVSYRESEEAITIRPNLLTTGAEGLEKTLEKKIWKREKGRLPFSWRISGAMDIGRDADYLGGAFSIQSESSMMAALAMTPRRGQMILDCCAAPGGKTCLMAELMAGTGRVQAWDVHEHRRALIEAQARRLGLDNIRTVTRDALKRREDLTESMDGVLLDAPCSGLGVLAEKPDIKLRITEESLAELTELQGKLLDTVCEYVKEGGILVYSTCSLLKDENERQCAAFLERHPEFEAVKLPESIPEEFRKHEQLGLQLLPYRDGVEGFYICRMRKKEGTVLLK